MWIGLSWIGAALFLAPLISGREAAGQARLVYLLFLVTVVIVAGALLGDYLVLLCHKFVCCVLCGALAARAAGQGAGDCAGDGDPDGCDRIWHVTLRSDRGIRGVDNLRVGDILR